MFLISGAAITAVKIDNVELFNRGAAGRDGTYVGVPVIYSREFGLYRRVCKDGFSGNEADFLCRRLGFPDGGNFTTYKKLEERYQISRDSRILDRPGNLTITNCTENATSLADCTYNTGMNCTIDESVALKCNPVWTLEKVELKRNISTTAVVSGSYGTLVLTMKRRTGGFLKSAMAYHGGYGHPKATNDFFCREAGYPLGAEYNNYGTNGDNHNDSLAETFIGSNFTFDGYIYCPVDAQEFSECAFYRPFQSVQVSKWEDGMVLYCKTNSPTPAPTTEPSPDPGPWNSIVTIETGQGENSTTGTVVLTNQDTLKKGLICGKDVDQHTADLICRAAGSRYAEVITTNYEVPHDDRLDCSYIKEYDIEPVLYNVTCPLNLDALSQEFCSASSATSDECDADSALHLTCTDDIPSVWRLVHMALARNPGGGHNAEDVIWDGDFGTAVGTLYNRDNGTFLTGLVPIGAIQRNPYCNTQAMCRTILGIQSSKTYSDHRGIGELEESQGKGLSCGYIIGNNISFLPITSMDCGCGAGVTIDDCGDIVVSQHSFQRGLGFSSCVSRAIGSRRGIDMIYNEILSTHDHRVCILFLTNASPRFSLQTGICHQMPGCRNRPNRVNNQSELVI
eukprot:sb/3463037/